MRYHHGDLKDAVAAESQKLISKFGVDAFSFRKIAAKLGVSQTAIYRHFRNKEAIYCELAKSGFDQLGAHLEACEAESGQIDTIFNVCIVYFDYQMNQSNLCQIMFGSIISKEGYLAHTELSQSGKQAFQKFCRPFVSYASRNRFCEKDYALRALNSWSYVHGLADLKKTGALEISKPELCDLKSQLVSTVTRIIS